MGRGQVKVRFDPVSTGRRAIQTAAGRWIFTVTAYVNLPTSQFWSTRVENATTTALSVFDCLWPVVWILHPNHFRDRTEPRPLE